MSIKNVVNRLEISKLFFLPAMFCILVPQIMKVHNSIFYALETTLVVVTLGMLLFRLFYAPSALQRSDDPGLLYSVLETLDKSTLWFAGKYKPEESYKPYFSTSQFLAENNLTSDIGYGKFSPYIFLVIIVPNLAIAWFLYAWTHQLISVAVVLILMVVLLFQMARSSRRAADPTPVVRREERKVEVCHQLCQRGYRYRGYHRRDRGIEHKQSGLPPAADLLQSQIRPIKRGQRIAGPQNSILG